MGNKKVTWAILLMFVFSMLAPFAPAQVFASEGSVDDNVIETQDVNETDSDFTASGEGEGEPEFTTQGGDKGNPKKPPKPPVTYGESLSENPAVCNPFGGGTVTGTKTTWTNDSYWNGKKWVPEKTNVKTVPTTREATDAECPVPPIPPAPDLDPVYGEWTGTYTCDNQTVYQTRTVQEQLQEFNHNTWKWEVVGLSDPVTQTATEPIRMSQAEFEADCFKPEGEIDWVSEGGIEYDCPTTTKSFQARLWQRSVDLVDFGTHYDWQQGNFVSTNTVEPKADDMSQDDINAHCSVTADEPLYTAVCGEQPTIEYAPTANVSYAQVPVDGQPGFVMVVATADPGYILTGTTEFGPYDMNVEPCEPAETWMVTAADLACSGDVTITISNPDSVEQYDHIRINLYQDGVRISDGSIAYGFDPTPGESEQHHMLDTSGWKPGSEMYVEVLRAGRMDIPAVSQVITCDEEPVEPELPYDPNEEIFFCMVHPSGNRDQREGTYEFFIGEGVIKVEADGTFSFPYGGFIGECEDDGEEPVEPELPEGRVCIVIKGLGMDGYYEYDSAQEAIDEGGAAIIDGKFVLVINANLIDCQPEEKTDVVPFSNAVCETGKVTEGTITKTSVAELVVINPDGYITDWEYQPFEETDRTSTVRDMTSDELADCDDTEEPGETPTPTPDPSPTPGTDPVTPTPGTGDSNDGSDDGDGSDDDSNAGSDDSDIVSPVASSSDGGTTATADPVTGLPVSGTGSGSGGISPIYYMLVAVAFIAAGAFGVRRNAS